MNRAIAAVDALDELRLMCAATSHPLLDDTELARLLGDAKRWDRNGKKPSEDGWIETYDLDYAAAEGWRRKAGKAAGDYDFEDMNSTLHRSHVIKHCREMVDEYLAKIAPVPVKAATASGRTPSEEYLALYGNLAEPD